MKRLFSLMLALALGLPLALPVAAAPAPGTLIKASTAAVYYYAADGKRYVFPNEKTYFTWYANFSGVVTVTDAELAAIQIGGNVTYRPGTKLVKITTDPKVYMVVGSQLRWVETEAVANALFGATWNKQVDDIPDAFFTNYTVGASIPNVAAIPTIPTNLTIQSIIDGNATTPETPTTPPPANNDIPLTLTLNKSEAQVYEQVDLLAQTSSTNAVTSLIIKIDGNGQLTSCPNFSCSTTWNVPSAGTQSQYTFRAILTLKDGRTKEITATLTIVSMPLSSAIKVTANRFMLKPNQFPNIRAVVEPSLIPSRTDIFINDVSVKACTTTPTPCEYPNYLLGDIGTTYKVHAEVQTVGQLTYKSAPITITIAENDTPLIQIVPSGSPIQVGDALSVVVTADDDDGIGQVTVSLDGQVVKTCTGAAPCTVNAGPWGASGTHTFTVRALDLKNAESTASLDVVVQ